MDQRALDGLEYQRPPLGSHFVFVGKAQAVGSFFLLGITQAVSPFVVNIDLVTAPM